MLQSKSSNPPKREPITPAALPARLRREDVALLFGVSKPTIRRAEKKGGLLHKFVHGSGPQTARWFRRAEILELRARMLDGESFRAFADRLSASSAALHATAAGAGLAARAFALFGAGRSVADVMVALGLDEEAAEALLRRYEECGQKRASVPAPKAPSRPPAKAPRAHAPDVLTDEDLAEEQAQIAALEAQLEALEDKAPPSRRAG
jgi:hypothetical protein